MTTFGGGPRPKRGPSYRNAYMVDTYRGVLRGRGWPSRRPTRPDVEQRTREAVWRLRNKAYAYIDPRQQIVAQEATKGTPLMPRDLFLAALYQRLLTYIEPGGREIWPMAARRDVSESLDVLGQTAGDVLARGDEYWQPVQGGQDGQVLTHQGPGKLPAWSLPPAGGSRGTNTTLQYSQASTSLYATKGVWFTPLIDLKLIGAFPTIDAVLGADYVINVVELAGDEVSAILDFTAPWTSPDNFQHRPYFPITQTPILKAGTRYAVAVTRTDGATTDPAGTGIAAAQDIWMPTTQEAGWCRFRTTNPAVGQIWDVVDSVTPNTVNLIYAIE